jgi:glutathione S-transferase
VKGHLEFMEQRGLVDADPYWMGAQAGVVDVVFWPWFKRFVLHTHYRGLDFPGHCVRLSKWIEAMRARLTVAAASVPLDFYIDGYARFAGPVRPADD